MPTHARWRDQQLTWAKASLCEAFVREHGRAHGRRWVAGAIACMDDWCRVFADALDRESGPELLAAKA